MNARKSEVSARCSFLDEAASRETMCQTKHVRITPHDDSSPVKNPLSVALAALDSAKTSFCMMYSVSG
jgi:hypothetical protein